MLISAQDLMLDILQKIMLEVQVVAT